MTEQKKDGRGGKREGAGRKVHAVGERNKAIKVYLSVSEYKKITEKAKKRCIVLSDFIRKFLLEVF